MATAIITGGPPPSKTFQIEGFSKDHQHGDKLKTLTARRCFSSKFVLLEIEGEAISVESEFLISAIQILCR